MAQSVLWKSNSADASDLGGRYFDINPLPTSVSDELDWFFLTRKSLRAMSQNRIDPFAAEDVYESIVGDVELQYFSDRILSQSRRSGWIFPNLTYNYGHSWTALAVSTVLPEASDAGRIISSVDWITATATPGRGWRLACNTTGFTAIIRTDAGIGTIGTNPTGASSDNAYLLFCGYDADTDQGFIRNPVTGARSNIALNNTTPQQEGSGTGITVGRDTATSADTVTGVPIYAVGMASRAFSQSEMNDMALALVPWLAERGVVVTTS